LAPHVATYSTVDDVEVSFEVDTVEGFEPAGIGDVVGKVRDAIEPAVLAAREVLARVKQLSPDEVQVKFGIKATGTMNWLVARSAGEGSFEVTLAWRPGSGPEPSEGS
jgi:hypothetical protein